MSNTPAEQPMLQVSGIVKTFPGVRALDGVDLTLRRGEVHALMGENGAGKSTLIKVLTGVHVPDGGEIRMDGKLIQPTSPRDAESQGISTVYQEVNLIPSMSVAENLCLGRFPKLAGLIRPGAAKKRAREALKRLDMDLDVSRQLSSYSLAVQQMVAIARALDTDAKLLILDEPTSSLDEQEVDELLAMMDRLRKEGLGILFVTHFIDQVYRISDRITVFRNGGFVGEYPTAELPRLKLIGKMVGKDVAALETQEADAKARHGRTSAGETLVKTEGLGRRNTVYDVQFDIQQGQTVGLAGLLGSGRTETAKMLFGVDPADVGTIKLDGEQVSPRSPREAMRLGFAMTPEDRKAAGIIPNLSVRENIMLALQSRRGILRRLSAKDQRELADKYIEALGIKTPDREQLVKNLSGGNQQKVLLGRWLAIEPRLFILDEPTRGIDVGAKAQIESLIGELTEQGMSILFISSEMEEVARTSDRVVVMRDRHQVGRLEGDEVSEHAILNMIAKHTTEASTQTQSAGGADV